MKMNIPTTVFLFLFLSLGAQAQSPEMPNHDHCKVSNERQSSDPILIKERNDLEYFTKNFSPKDINTGSCYVIPVVFHVYGTSQGGMPVNDAIIIDALDKVNIDFHGLNADFATVHNSFLSIRSTMPDVEFALAQIDPNGNPTTGIEYLPVTAGYANGSGYDAAIAADAWDNYKYMNVYVMNDLFNDGVTNNSGYAYYPSTSMSNSNTARVVYNGAYLGINCTWQPEFASTLSHEFGHWLNLIHTFEGGCVAPNDNVADTPPCDFLGSSYGCHPSPSANSPLNCTSSLINAENYMDYSGASGCYKMFTQGQTTRMYAALQVASRQPLWQMSNLIATGLDSHCSTASISSNNDNHSFVYPNPSSGIFNVSMTNNVYFEKESVVDITDMLGKVIYSFPISNNNTSNISINISNTPTGLYFINVHQKGRTETYKLILN